jgi:hypothetical protein
VVEVLARAGDEVTVRMGADIRGTVRAAALEPVGEMP